MKKQGSSRRRRRSSGRFLKMAPGAGNDNDNHYKSINEASYFISFHFISIPIPNEQ